MLSLFCSRRVLQGGVLAFVMVILFLFSNALNAAEFVDQEQTTFDSDFSFFYTNYLFQTFTPGEDALLTNVDVNIASSSFPDLNCEPPPNEENVKLSIYTVDSSGIPTSPVLSSKVVPRQDLVNGWNSFDIPDIVIEKGTKLAIRLSVASSPGYYGHCILYKWLLSADDPYSDGLLFYDNDRNEPTAYSHIDATFRTHVDRLDIDQYQDLSNETLDDSGPDGYRAQTFTVGKSGHLHDVEVKISAPACPTNESKLVEIVELDANGDPAGIVRGIGELVLPEEGYEKEWVSVTFDSVRVSAGEVLGVRIADAGDTPRCVFDWHFLNTGSDYTGGTIWLGHTSGQWFNAGTAGDAAFRTFVLEIESGVTDPGTDVEVVPEAVDENGDPVGTSPVSFQFDEVTGGGETTVTVSGAGTPATSGYRIGDPPTYYNLETTATFLGNVEVCISYSGVSYSDESTLTLLHNADGNGGWVDITTTLDTDNDIICGSTTSFSEFAVFEQLTPEQLLLELKTQTESINANNGVLNSLDGKLSAVENALADTNENNDGAAANALEAFISTTENQATNGKISHEEAANLIQAAEEIIDVMS